MAIRTRRRAPPQSPQVRSGEIVDAAVKVFARTPYRAARTAEIAAEAGIAEGTIFRYFGVKRELYLAALGRCMAVVRDEYRALADSITDAQTAVRAMAHCSQERAIIDPDTLRLRQRAAAESEDDEVRMLLIDGYREIHRIVAEVMRRGQQQGTMRHDTDVDAAAWLFLASGLLLDTIALLGAGAEECLDLCRAMGAVQRRALLVDPG